jgi:dihydroorotate dehydrogenase (NAD+) catalytic subunit
MKVQLAGLTLVNPVIAASGTFGYGTEFEEIVSLERIGGFVTKGISLQPMNGHPAPRILQTAAGMMNASGSRTSAWKSSSPRSFPRCAAIPNAM